LSRQVQESVNPIDMSEVFVFLKDFPYGFFSFFFSVSLLSVLRGHSFFHPHPYGQWPSTSKDFYPRFYRLYFYHIASISLFNVEC